MHPEHHRPSPAFLAIWATLNSYALPATMRKVAIVPYDAAFAACQVARRDIRPALTDWEQRMTLRARQRALQN